MDKKAFHDMIKTDKDLYRLFYETYRFLLTKIRGALKVPQDYYMHVIDNYSTCLRKHLHVFQKLVFPFNTESRNASSQLMLINLRKFIQLSHDQNKLFEFPFH